MPHVTAHVLYFQKHTYCQFQFIWKHFDVFVLAVKQKVGVCDFFWSGVLKFGRVPDNFQFFCEHVAFPVVPDTNIQGLEKKLLFMP